MKVVNPPFVYFLSLFVPGDKRQRWQIWRRNMEKGKGTQETGPKMLSLFNSAAERTNFTIHCSSNSSCSWNYILIPIMANRYWLYIFELQNKFIENFISNITNISAGLTLPVLFVQIR